MRNVQVNPSKKTFNECPDWQAALVAECVQLVQRRAFGNESTTTKKGTSAAISTWKDTYDRPDATKPTIVSDDFDEVVNEPWEKKKRMH